MAEEWRVSLKRERRLTHGNRLQSRIQTRGGGEGGMSERELAVSGVRVNLSAGDERSTIAEGISTTAVAFEHFSPQPAKSAQSPFACLSQCSIFSQQSDCAATDDPCGE
jgi:hypothetical protein